MFNVRLVGDHLYGGNGCSPSRGHMEPKRRNHIASRTSRFRHVFAGLAVTGDIFDGVLFCVVLFPTRCLR